MRKPAGARESDLVSPSPFTGVLDLETCLEIWCLHIQEEAWFGFQQQVPSVLTGLAQADSLFF